MSNFRRLIYASVAVCDDCDRDRIEILRQSRANNGIDGISGFLWTNGTSYLQVFEGAPDTVASVLQRIETDPRHTDVKIVSDQLAQERAFGDWTMASLPAERDQALLRDRLNRFLRNAPDDVRTALSDLGL